MLFLTLTFNTTRQDLHAFTTNWPQSDTCWEPLTAKKPWLRRWANQFDPTAEPLKVKILKTSPEIANSFNQASQLLSKFLRKVRHTFKPTNWKWVVIAELQKNGHWHFHFLSTPLIPYAHNCTLTKNFKSCWNCRTYLTKLWPHGRVESRSTGRRTISQYLAKYLSKSFHLRQIYQQHGLTSQHKTYRFFKNLYSYEQKEAILKNNSKFDQLTGQYLPRNQHLFRRSDNSYYYRLNEQLTGHCAKPLLIKKSYRLGYHSLSTLSLLKLAHQPKPQEPLSFRKNLATKLVPQDFQEYLITSLLLLAKQAEFLNLPPEQPIVPHSGSKCDQLDYTHFQKKPILRFKFSRARANLVKEFILNLDNQAETFDLDEAQNFTDSRFPDPLQSRNAYLNRWIIDYHVPWRQEGRVMT